MTHFDRYTTTELQRQHDVGRTLAAGLFLLMFLLVLLGIWITDWRPFASLVPVLLLWVCINGALDQYKAEIKRRKALDIIETAIHDLAGNAAARIAETLRSWPTPGRTAAADETAPTHTASGTEIPAHLRARYAAAQALRPTNQP